MLCFSAIGFWTNFPLFLRRRGLGTGGGFLHSHAKWRTCAARTQMRSFCELHVASILLDDELGVGVSAQALTYFN